MDLASGLTFVGGKVTQLKEFEHAEGDSAIISV